MTDCDGPLHPHARKGILLFNQGKYFEAHEELEAAWKDERGPVRQLYQGILEVAVTYLHISRGNYDGAIKVYGRSMKWLTQWPATCRGVEVDQLRHDMQAVIAEVRRLGDARIAEFDRSLLKPLLWKEVRDEH
jgi:predicted metal-dependent hydrolase